MCRNFNDVLLCVIYVYYVPPPATGQVCGSENSIPINLFV